MAKTILILAANPLNRPQLRLDQEIREIEGGLERADKRDRFILEQKLATRPVDVRRAMLHFKPNIVHFCGHGSGDEGIAFEDSNGQAILVSSIALAGLFELFADRVECVVLNACYSETQAEAIAKHIPYVIGMRQAIGDTAAIEFAVAFYDALGAGEGIEFAYRLACNAILWLLLPVDLMPVLMKKESEPTDTAQFMQQRGVYRIEPLQDDRLKDFVEVLQHRADVLLNYFDEQLELAIATDTPKRSMYKRRYKEIKKEFLRYHQGYIEAVNSGKAQLAHEQIGQIYRLIYDATFENKVRPPQYYIRIRKGD
jgi:hypothetical protein